jgi:hypothetical protein
MSLALALAFCGYRSEGFVLRGFPVKPGDDHQLLSSRLNEVAARAQRYLATRMNGYCTKQLKPPGSIPLKANIC